ncbi:hypothetical protein ATANTOWER_027889 [Ataeniobius toweri]|uniref:Secreted protein n=1 Tax=Ataeniobius toweri TaxID=208326 RepID=A0ABU7BEV4_9TELE|nr:hypothetical protein [Ataeniobius toweri]
MCINFPVCVHLSVWLTAFRHISSGSIASTKLKTSSGDNSGSCHIASYVPLSFYLPGFSLCYPSLYPGEDSLVRILAKAADKSRAAEITHFNRPVKSVFRTCGGLLLQASE